MPAGYFVTSLSLLWLFGRLPVVCVSYKDGNVAGVCSGLAALSLFLASTGTTYLTTAARFLRCRSI
jgi:hypothetical protein